MQKIELEKIYTIAVTNVPEVFRHTHALVKGSKYTRAALGLHPELAAQHRHQLPLFQELLSETRYVGEVGLDKYNKSSEDFAYQMRVFEKILLACTAAKGKILTVHSRRAEKEVIEMIGGTFPGKVILHWYSGSLSELDKALARGFYFSINYAMTLSENGKKIIAHLPTNRILLETDGPFVKIGDSACDPTVIPKIAEKIISLIKVKGRDFSIFDFHNNFKSLVS
jgi:TatD DNase family protein